MSEKELSQNEPPPAVENQMKTGKKHFSGVRLLANSVSNRMNNIIATNVTIAIGSRIQGQKSEIYVNDMPVKLDAKHICYPDVVVVSGVPQFVDKECDMLVNPTVAFDIFSKNTSFQDKTEKLECYLAMGSIREYVLIKEDEMRVEHYSKQNAKQWIYKIYNERDDVISVDSINCKISIAEIYAQVKFVGGEAQAKSGS
ncbi:MAG: Uma2 family endonuclease [Pyrinomonadaceae bacterium]|nr:Uma2 family endonuclease [Pyrinomonadaceae bacterium]